MKRRNWRGMTTLRLAAAGLSWTAPPWCSTSARGEDGRLFGAVTNADVADRLNQGELDFEVDRRIVLLEEPLKLLGVSKVLVRLHSQVEVEVEIQVEQGEE